MARSKRQQRPFWRINEKIQASKLRVIDPEGKQLGIFSASKALELSQKKGLDLVEIAPRANPPVVKIIDFTKFRYQEEKKQRAAKKKERRGSEQKEIWLKPFMADNDYKVRLEKIIEFLGEGHKVKIAVRFLGRQMGHKEFGYQIAKRVAKDTEGLARVDVDPKFIGRQLILTLAPVKRQEEKDEKNKDEN